MVHERRWISTKLYATWWLRQHILRSYDKSLNFIHTFCHVSNSTAELLWMTSGQHRLKLRHGVTWTLPLKPEMEHKPEMLRLSLSLHLCTQTERWSDKAYLLIFHNTQIYVCSVLSVTDCSYKLYLCINEPQMW